ncbi:hypothetical protein [Saccharibacillus sacchari]|uniref:Uncharacterized protein n=1 Tax=Saccharibacillus sacchari TaxID=456493 RepID=A0ACC6PEM8_9BACL
MLGKKLGMPVVVAMASLLALTACSPTEWAAKVVTDRLAPVERHPDQQRPLIGYVSASQGYSWKSDGQTEPSQAWQNVPEVQTMYDPEEVDLAHNTGFTVRDKTITGKSLEDIVKQAAAYEYKHQVDGIHIDAEIIEGDHILASFPYRYEGEPYQGVVLAKRKGNGYVYERMSFSPELTDEGKPLPFVPGNGTTGINSKTDSDIRWVGGNVNDERIRTIVMVYENGPVLIPIKPDQATYLIADDGEIMESNLLYIEAQDENGKALYTWQYS